MVQTKQHPTEEQSEASGDGLQAQAGLANKANAEEVPERPALAPNVKLSGEMQESGFEKKQWLVQRDGSFSQVTELLYHVLKQVNGQRSIDEIAQAASQEFGRTISADGVRKLIGTKLIPEGFIVKADGSVAQAPGATGKGLERSPLAVNMRVKMIDPRFITPFTNVLQYLYKPLILVPILLLSVVLHGWLYFMHGVGHGTYDLLYTPGLILAIFGIVVISTAFHELGHASALQYGGGKVGGMGAGLYIVYPAFFTDVTDNYRLGRWARVRTDLGGFYFNLIFQFLLAGLFALTKQEFLLLPIMLIDFDIIHQLLPFVRLDGYWALADITGIPDFFSQIGPFLRSVLPLPWWKGRKLPDLKGWVKAVFALYIVITVPLLAFLLFLMVKGVPRILATAWDSFLKQTHDFSSALSAGDVLAVIVAVLQMVLLALPTLGLLYALYGLARRGFTALWNWSKPTPQRRAIGSLVTLGIVGLLVFLWAPQIPFLGGRPGPARTITNFTPIKPNERGTIGDAIPVWPFVAFSSPSQPAAPATVVPATPESAPSIPTAGPQVPVPAGGPSLPEPTPTPVVTPQANPNVLPTQIPQVVPTIAPKVPQVIPTQIPQLVPTAVPQIVPTQIPQIIPTAIPPVNSIPTVAPKLVPTVNAVPTEVPKLVPTVNAAPTLIPTVQPKLVPTPAPPNLPPVQPKLP